MNTGNVYVESNNFEQAEELYLKAYTEIQRIDAPENQALITYNLGNLYFKQKKYSLAIEYAEKALASYTSIGKQSSLELANRLS